MTLIGEHSKEGVAVHGAVGEDIGEASNPMHNKYPGTPQQNSYHGPTLTEIGTNAVNEGANRSKIRLLAHLKSLPFRWKLSVLVTVTAFILSILLVNSCNFVTIKRVYPNDQITTYFGRGVIKGQLNPWDECTEWREYENLDIGARVEAARVGAVGCTVLGALLISLLLKDAFCDGCWSKCFPRRMWRSVKMTFCLLAAGFQALVQLLVWSHFCKKGTIEGEDDNGETYTQTCSTNTSSFGVSIAVICLFLFDFVLVF